jgi:hypothetical protein
LHTLSAKRNESRKSKNKREQKQIMSNKLSKQFFQTIISKENKNLTLYAILDAARSSNIYMHIDEVEHYNLFEDEEAQLLEEVAPYLVSLEEDDSFTKAMLSEEYGNSSILFVYSNYSIEELANFFRQYTKVIVDGQEAFFAFYDPRVFNRFMKRASKEELEAFFSLVSVYACEDDDDSKKFTEYRYTQNKVVKKSISLAEEKQDDNAK